MPSESEWEAVRHSYEDLRPGMALGREFLSRSFGRRRVVFVHTGENPVEAAVSAQYAVDRWSPRVLASDTEHDAFMHVASRNGLPLTPVDSLGLVVSDFVNAAYHRAGPQTVAEAGEIAGTGEIRITATGVVVTSDDVNTTEEVSTGEAVITDDDRPTTG